MVLNKSKTPLTFDVQISYSGERGLYAVGFPALGTNCSIQFEAASKDQATSYARAAAQWVANFESKYSRFRDDSLISKINQNAGKEWIEVDDEVESIFQIVDDLHFMTHGVLDPTMLPLILLWDYRKTRDALPSDEEAAAAKRLVGWNKVERRPGAVYLPEEGMALDLGGFGKEYAVDKVAALAVSHGIANCLVDFGRDIHALGAPPKMPAWHIGLENPEQPDGVWGSIAATNCGIATSGDYRRYFEYNSQRYGHIIDPRTGRPVVNNVLSVFIVANSCLEAGVLSTAAFVLGADEGMRLIEESFGAEACLVMTDGIQQSGGFIKYVVQG